MIITVQYEGIEYRFRQLASGASEKDLATGIPSGKWEGFIRLALLTEPPSNQALKDVCEAMTKDGFAGLVVGDTGLRFSQWEIVSVDTEDAVAHVSIQYTTLRDRPEFEVREESNTYIVRRRS